MVSKKVLFSETQKFTQWWIWAIFIVLNSIFLYGIYQQILMGEPYGDNPASDTGLLLSAGGLLLLTVLFYILKLETTIKEDGVYVRFFPFHTKFRRHPWEKITRAYVRKYSPLAEYGGWGLRIGFRGNALNVSGNMGLQLEFTDRRGLLIGTQKPDEIGKVLEMRAADVK